MLGTSKEVVKGMTQKTCVSFIADSNVIPIKIWFEI